MATILILIGGHLCTAPRPQKEAETLANAGHNVIVQGVWFDPIFADRDLAIISKAHYSFQPAVDMRPGTWKNYSERLKGRAARELFRKANIFSPALLGYGAGALLPAARQVRADLTIVHSEAGLWVGNRLLDEGLNVGVDFEDWFSEDLLPEARRLRPIAQIKALESRLARECTYCLTTSNAMADALSAVYRSPRPTVVYNSFPWHERIRIDHQKKDRKSLDIPSLHWFSQTIGPGRGLEMLMMSLNGVSKPCEVHIRGNYTDAARRWFEPLIPPVWREHVFIHETVSNDELLSRIAEHDIGLALELTDVPSRNPTVTNKLFQYLQAGLAVIATDTAGQREILSQCPEVGQLIPPGDPAALGAALISFIDNPNKLHTAKQNGTKSTEERYCWEKQEAVLIECVENAFSSSLCNVANKSGGKICR